MILTLWVIVNVDKQAMAIFFSALALIATAAFTVAKNIGLSNRVDTIDRLQQDVRSRQITVLIEIERLKQRDCHK